MSSPNYIWYYYANAYFPKELLTSKILEDLMKRLIHIQLTPYSKPITNFVAFIQDIKKVRTRVHKFGDELSNTSILVS